MFGNYFKIAYRIMVRNKTFTGLNLSGLMLGITGALLLFLWIEKEFSYEQFHIDKDRIYKAWNRTTGNGSIHTWDVTPRVLASSLKEEYASIERAVSFATWGSSQLFTVNKKRILKTTGAYTDPDFLSIFSFPLIKGEATTALTGPKSIVLTENFARQLFDDKDPYGQTLTIGESGYSFELTVTGVLKDLPSNTAFNFDYLIPFHFLESLGEKDTFWGNNSVSTYVKVQQGSDIRSVNNSIKDIEKKHYKDGQHIDIFLYPLTQMRLYSKFENGVPVGGRIETIRMLVILGLSLLIVACINFVNLSTARAQRRAKEVAVRKVTGAHYHSLIIQFLCESTLITLCAGLFSFIAAYLLLPYFNSLIGQQLEFTIMNPRMLGWSTAFMVFLGILAGSYPALYLSSFKPVSIFGRGVKIIGRSVVRNCLVILQFGFAVILIVSTIVIYSQIDFVQKRDGGYNRDNLVYQQLTGDLEKNFLSYRDDLIQSNIAISVTKTSAPLTERWSSSTEMQWRGKQPAEKNIIERIYADQKLATTAGLTIIAGRDMDLEKYPSDSTAMLLNESAAKMMGFADPIGEIITDNGMQWNVIGIVKDFILTSPYQKIEPIVLIGSKAKWALQVVHIRLNSSLPVDDLISRISQLSVKYNPNYPFEYHFVDVEYERKFANMKATLITATVFACVSVCIACLGLFGLSTYLAEAKIKEIGIRKVLGGTVANITALLSIASLKPILVGVIVSTPLAWLGLNRWLQTFEYRTNLNLGIFLIASGAIAIVALLTISVQTIKAARANPIKSLRSE